MLWLHMEIEAGFSWPNTLVEFPHEGNQVVLGPRTETLACSANLYVDTGTTFEEGGSSLSRFLSLLAWAQDASLVDRSAVGSNHPSVPTRVGHGGRRTSSWSAIDPWQVIYLPTISDPQAALALALYREGMGVSSAPLAFLSFFKVFNILHASGGPQRAWIDSNLSGVTHGPAVDRLAELRLNHQDIGEYLWEQGRCAVAHANSSTVNPDEYADKRRLFGDLPLIKELAALFIETEFRVERSATFMARIRESGADQPQLYVQDGTRDGRLVYVPFKRL